MTASASSLSPEWVPLAERRVGILMVGIVAILSLCAIASLVTYSSYLLWQHYRRSPLERIDFETRGTRFLASMHGCLLFNLLAGDFIQAFGFALNFRWIQLGAYPATTNHVCVAQGVLIQLGDVASIFGSLLIGGYIFSILVLSCKPPVKVVVTGMILEWLIVMLMGGLGPWAIEKSGKPFYAFAGGWCWIGNNYQQERLLLHYLWVFVIAGMNLVLYSAIALRIFLQRRQIGVASLSSQANVARVMLLYPIVYIICVLPLATYRIHTMRTATSWPIQVALGAGCVFTSSGLCNCIVYALTRRIVSLDSLRRRTTTTMVEREGAGGAEERGRTLAWERSPTGSLRGISRAPSQEPSARPPPEAEEEDMRQTHILRFEDQGGEYLSVLGGRKISAAGTEESTSTAAPSSVGSDRGLMKEV